MGPFLFLALSVGFAPQEVGREAVESLVFPPLVFEPPAVGEYEIEGVPIFHLYDPTVSLVDVQLQLVGGSSHFPRTQLGSVSAFPFILRRGGTASESADSVDRTIDLLALQVNVGSGGGGTSIQLNALPEAVWPGMTLLQEMVLTPAFEPQALEVWRGQTVERIRRREDNPGGLAFSEFNRLMYGDHPVGWVMDTDDLLPDRLSVESLRALHDVLVCKDRLFLGVSGDLTWEEAEPLVREFLEPWPECSTNLTPTPEPNIRSEPGVFVLPRRIDQTTVILAQPSDVLQEDSPEYFAAQIANRILGAGGFSSRILSRVRTEQGLAYGASSVWTTPLRYQGLLGALTATGAGTTVRATNLLLEILREFRIAPPSADEIRQAVEEITNGYLFAFQSPSEIVARQMLHRAQGLPDGWMVRFLDGLREVTDETVASVVTENLNPDRMTILLVGDPSRFDSGLDAFDPVFELLPSGSYRPWVSPGRVPDGSPQSPP